MTLSLRVVVADDQTLVRTGFRMILMVDGIDVVAEATNGLEAVDVVRRTRPDVVLMNVRMPNATASKPLSPNSGCVTVPKP